MKVIIKNLVGLCALLLVPAAPVLGQTATDVNCDGCVHSGDIATNGVRRADIQNFSINTPKLNNFAVTTEKIRTGAVTGSKVDASQVQLRVAGSCAVGSFISSIATDGTVTCGDGGDEGNGLNTRYGRDALLDNATGANTAIGWQSLRDNTTGTWNTAIGPDALGLNTIGNLNTAVGVNALWKNIDGGQNVAYGVGALKENVSGLNNTAVGFQALNSSTIWAANTAIGFTALRDHNDGDGNTAVGYSALWDHQVGSDNTAIGTFAGAGNLTGSFNISIGSPGVDGENNTTRIGSANQWRTFVTGVNGVTTGVANAVTVVIDSAGQLGTVSSSRRYKEDISDMGSSSDRLLQLHPVTFRYKGAYANGEKPLDYGLIAEEVAEVFPELVVFNGENEPETVKYRLLSSMLLNEVQKQYLVNQQQDAQLTQVAELRAQVAELSEMVIRMAQTKATSTD